MVEAPVVLPVFQGFRASSAMWIAGRITLLLSHVIWSCILIPAVLFQGTCLSDGLSLLLLRTRFMEYHSLLNIIWDKGPNPSQRCCILTRSFLSIITHGGCIWHKKRNNGIMICVLWSKYFGLACILRLKFLLKMGRTTIKHHPSVECRCQIMLCINGLHYCRGDCLADSGTMSRLYSCNVGHEADHHLWICFWWRVRLRDCLSDWLSLPRRLRAAADIGPMGRGDVIARRIWHPDVDALNAVPQCHSGTIRHGMGTALFLLYCKSVGNYFPGPFIILHRLIMGFPCLLRNWATKE